MKRSVQLHICEGWRDELARAGLDSFDALMHTTAGECMSHHRRGEVRRIELPGGEAVYLKRDLLTMLKQVLADLLSGRRPQPFTVKERLGIERASALGIRAAEPIAWGQRRRFRLPWQGVLVTGVLAGEPLHVWLASNKDRSERAGILREVGCRVARLYSARLSWPDLLPKHIFTDDRGSIGLLDLERLRPTCRPLRCMRKQVSGLVDDLRGLGVGDEELEAFESGLRSS